MGSNPTPRHRAANTNPYSKGDNVIELNDLARRRRAWRRDAAPVEAPLRGGGVLGYFWHGACLQVTYGATQILWLGVARTSWPVATFAEFDRLEYQRFAKISWGRGTTSFTYCGTDVEPGWMTMHSPDEATILRKTLVIHRYCTTANQALDPADGLVLNPAPEYLDPTNPQSGHLPDW